MSPKQRILTFKLFEKQKKYPEFMKRLGVEVKVNKSNKMIKNK